MTTDTVFRRLERQLAADERNLRALQRRKDREPALRESYYQLKASVVRRKSQLAEARAQLQDAPGGVA